jgi:hypothetical protein
MIETLLNPRIVESKDWATILFLLGFILIVITKTTFEVRFNDFKNLIVSDKYLKVYKDSSHLMSGFTIILFFVQLISFAFFIQLFLNSLGYVSKTDWIAFIQIITFLMVFILSKFLIEKIIATAFDIEELAEQLNLQKVSYRTYISLIILPIDIILYYNDLLSKNLIYFIIVTIVALNVITYIVSLKNYQNLIISKLFYFILYLCALEIAPYYFMYYWFTNK